MKKLSKTEKAEINKLLPNLGEIQHKIIWMTPEFSAIFLGPKSPLPKAAVCIKDCMDTLFGVLHAMSSALEHYKLSKKYKRQENIIGQYFLTKYYCDDVALRLYSAQEHLSNSIILLFKIDNSSLNFGQNKRGGFAGKLANLLKQKFPTDIITIKLNNLGKNKDWQTIIKYRNDWVHNQPPLIDGLGLQYKRIDRWQKSKRIETPETVKKVVPKIENEPIYQLTLTVDGDEKDFTLEQLLNICLNSFTQFVDLFDKVVDFYHSEFKDQKRTL